MLDIFNFLILYIANRLKQVSHLLSWKTYPVACVQKPLQRKLMHVIKEGIQAGFGVEGNLVKHAFALFFMFSLVWI